MEYVAMLVGVCGSWIVLRALANEREARIRAMHANPPRPDVIGPLKNT
jgi:hypothetical protein